MPPYRVLVVEDDAAARLGITSLIDRLPDLELAGEVAAGEQVVAAVQAHHPDVVLMDIQLGAMDGIEALREVRRLPAPPRVLMLTSFDVQSYVVDALDAGADGYLLKVRLVEELNHAIESVMNGEAHLSAASTRRLIDAVAAAGNSEATRIARECLATLSEKERDILVEVASGDTNAAIASRLYLAESTVKAHVAALSRKLGCNRIQAVVLAERAGLLRGGETGLRAGERPVSGAT